MTSDVEPTELRVVGALRDQIRQTAIPTGARQQPSWRRPGLLVGIAAALASIVTAVLLALSATSTAPAYAITRHRDGQVTVTLNLITSIGALNDKMEAMGLPIRAVPAVKGCNAPVRIIGPDHEPTGPARTLVVRPDGTHNGLPFYGRVISVTVLPPDFPDRTLVLAAGKTGFFYTAGETVQGPPPACFGISSHGPAFLLFAHP